MNINKLLLLAYIAMLIPAITVANPAVREDVSDALKELGITSILESHESRITSLETQVKQLWNKVNENEVENVVMKLSVKYNQTMNIGDTTCYPEDDLCITVEE